MCFVPEKSSNQPFGHFNPKNSASLAVHKFEKPELIAESFQDK